MTAEDVKIRLDRIRGCGKDYEALHSEEDALFVDVLTAIANGKCTDPAGIAKEALQSREIPGKRRCA